MDEKYDMVGQHINIFCLGGGGVMWRSSFLGNLKPLDNKLDLWRTPARDIFLTVFPSCPPYQPLPQITLSWAETLD